MQRQASIGLRPFVEMLWVSDSKQQRHEHVLPTGCMHLVFTLAGAPPFGALAVVGGARDAFYEKTTTVSRSVGAMIRPGACEWLLGVPAGKLANAHTDLALLWPKVGLLQERLCEAADPVATLDAILLERAPKLRGIPPHISFALAHVQEQSIAELVAEVGVSHRHFSSSFERAVGLLPKRFSRVRRLQAVLAQMGSLVETALDAGFSDQAHFTREFRRFSGVTPLAYRRLQLPFAHHMPVDFMQERKR